MADGLEHTSDMSHCMDIYDSLPREYRDILKNADLNILVMADDNLGNLDEFRLRLDSMSKGYTVLTYGPDHPQAA